MKSRHLHGIPADLATALGIQNHPGYFGSFTRRQAPGAYPNGTAIVKVAADPDGDLNPIGTRGVVLGSFSHPLVPGNYYYFIEWASRPGFATGCVAFKIRAA